MSFSPYISVKSTSMTLSPSRDKVKDKPDTTHSIVFNVTWKMAYKKVTLQLELTLTLYSQRIKVHLKVGHVPLFLEYFIQSLTFDVIVVWLLLLTPLETSLHNILMLRLLCIILVNKINQVYLFVCIYLAFVVVSV